MITEDYVSFETAKLLKNKGFDETGRAFWKVWNNHTILCSCSTYHLFEYCDNSMLEQYNDGEELNIAAPTLQMVMKWLREVHGLYITITHRFSHNADNDVCFGYYVNIYTAQDGEWLKYEEACEAAIKYCLENLI